MYSVMTKSYNGYYILEEDRQYNLILFRQEEVQNVGLSCYEYIPAWSLHRLMEILNAPAVEFSISTLEEAYEDCRWLELALCEGVRKEGICE